MLHEFIAENRDEIISRTRQRVTGRFWPSVSTDELEHGVPLLLTQLSETLRLEATDTPFPTDAIGATAARHGAELLEARLQRLSGRPRLRRHLPGHHRARGRAECADHG